MQHEPSKSALLVMDVQQGVVGRVPGAEVLLQNLKQAIDAARGAAIKVIYVRLAFRPEYPDVSPNNRSFSMIAAHAGDAFSEPSPALEIHPLVSPHADDLVVVKKRVSAFSGSDLELLLRSLQIDHLILTGVTTSGVVLSTVREAADKDFQLTVLSDACLDGDEQVHRLLTEKVFSNQAEVLSVNSWVAGLGD
jgi:nicotinamidase-related amidase